MPSKFLLRALILCVCISYCVCLNLTSEERKERKEFHRFFESYNKPAVKVIKTIHGDTYNCIDFYKQPAFDHPLLKNHSNDPKFFPQTSNVAQTSESLKSLWENGQGCPDGTIPIRKYTKKQFIHTHRRFQKLYPSDLPVEGRFRSSIHTQNGPHIFFGASGIFNYFNYPIEPSQYTAGYLIIRATTDQLQVGWTIYPEMYNDTLTRLFVRTKVGMFNCFNLMCPGGYIHTNKDVPIDAVLPNNTRGAQSVSFETTFKILKDIESNTWRLYGTYGVVNDTLYGYWPNEALKGLKGSAEYLEWGGEAYNPDGLKGPGMGSGFFPEGKFELDGSAKKLLKFDQLGQSYDITANETESYADDSNLYRIWDGGYVDDNVGHVVYYGGPGKL